MAIRKLESVTQEDIVSRLRYDNGKLFWLPRGHGKFDKQFANKEAGCYRPKDDCFVIAFKGTHILLSRAIWIYHNGEILKGMEIDHINRIRSDDRIENLRMCHRHENAWNTKRRIDNSSGVKGVCWNPRNNNWRAKLNVNKTTIEVGSFQTLEQASDAINHARLLHHGQFAYVGTPNGAGQQ
jgi:hypothetical protein